MSEKKQIKKIRKSLNQFGYIPKNKRKTAFEVKDKTPNSKVKAVTYYPNRRIQ